LPNTVLSNSDLEKMVDTSDEWIFKRTGIKERRVATAETVAHMAIQASKQALENAGLQPLSIDMVVCSTIGGDYITPSVACLVAGYFGLTVPAFDINAACSGFVYALDVVSAYIKSGKVKNVLLVGADKMSKVTDFGDRNTCVLFGDGAGAFVLTCGEQLKAITCTTQGSDEFMRIPSFEGNAPYTIKTGRQPYLYMNGQATYKFAVNALEQEVRKIVNKAGLQLDQIDWLVPHQANFRIIETASKALELNIDQVLSNIADCGNTVSACIPSMIHDAFESKKFKKGDVVVICVFGGGLTTGAAVLVV
jgi:3-oxoacyl-[acyl-carrier-protein] synthase-3